MKHFAYIIKDLRGNAGREKLCKLYVVKKNEVIFLGARKSSFESEGQMAINTAIELGALKGKSILRDAKSDPTYSTVEYRTSGIANFQYLGTYS